MKKITRNIIVLISFTMVYLIGCDDLSFNPTDQLTDEAIEERRELLHNVTNGNYSRLREHSYNKLRHDMMEFGSDDSHMGRTTSDHLLYEFNHDHIVNSNHSRNFWLNSYHALYSINEVLERITDNAPVEELQLKGENLFMRALLHFDLVRIFSRPYSHDSPETNMGVIIADKKDMEIHPARSSVKDTYDFIVQDLLKASELMTIDKGTIYASREIAWALLARAYLYMEENSLAIEYADKVINSGRHELISTENLRHYPSFIPESNPETIFAIKFLPSENLGRSAIGSFHNGNGGWGQIFASKPFRDLLFKHGTQDERIHFVEPDWVLDSDGNRIPDPTEDVYPGDDQGYLMGKRDTESRWWTRKMTGEQGIDMLHSPIIARLAEMYLIKAEASAKLGQDSEAIHNVNIIRERAGLDGAALYTTSDLKGHSSVLDVVLEERRLELAFEGHRMHDVFRNKRDLDRSHVLNIGWTGDPIIPWESNKIYNLIPETEILLNPNLKQNPLP